MACRNQSTAALVDRRRLGAVKAQFGAFDGLTQELTFAESGNPPIEIRLEANLGTISGTLVGEDGEAIRSCNANVHYFRG